MRKYVIEVVITEGSKEDWEELRAEGKTGCDEMVNMVKESLPLMNYDPEVKLKAFTDDESYRII